MWRRRGLIFRCRDSREMPRVLAVELAWAVPWRNNGPQEPGMVCGQAGPVRPRWEARTDRYGAHTTRPFLSWWRRHHEGASHSLRRDASKGAGGHGDATELRGVKGENVGTRAWVQHFTFASLRGHCLIMGSAKPILLSTVGLRKVLLVVASSTQWAWWARWVFQLS